MSTSENSACNADIVKMLKKTFSVVVCTSSFVYTFYHLCNFAYFLSNHNENEKSSLRATGDRNLIASTIWILLKDTCLIGAFMLQHSVMAGDLVKNVYSRFNVEELERSIYNATSVAVLQMLMINWQTVPWAALWNINTAYNSKLWLIFALIHTFGWFMIYSGCVMMDISELAGIKQVYYKISGRQKPLTMKSADLQRFFAHMRHPSFTGFLLILWIHPFMSIDRCLLAGLLTAYMILMWTVDQKDYNYHAQTIRIKQREFS